MRSSKFILAGFWLIGATLWAGAASAQPRADKPPAAATSRPAAAGGTLAAQQRLADRLKAIKGASLAATLSHNRAEWESLSPDQQSRFRREALAFLNEPPDQQDRLLRQYQRLISLSAERQADYRQIAQWLKVVVDSMTADERKALLEMPPEQRAKAVLARKAELVKQGKLPAEPTTQPTE